MESYWKSSSLHKSGRKIIINFFFLFFLFVFLHTPIERKTKIEFRIQFSIAFGDVSGFPTDLLIYFVYFPHNCARWNRGNIFFFLFTVFHCGWVKIVTSVGIYCGACHGNIFDDFFGSMNFCGLIVKFTE